MKIAYILFGNLNKKDAHVNSCLSFCSSFSKKEELVFSLAMSLKVISRKYLDSFY
jgi:hypothetical protein